MEEEKKIKFPTTGVFDFPSLILGGKGKYIDKTDLLYELCNDADQQLFISRPRRFGKSLMLSTLQAMFEGRRDLFKGLAVGETYELFIESLAKLVKGLCAQAGVPYDGTGPVSGQFEDFLKAAIKKSPTGQIVVLIDEYDEPVAKFLDDLETLKKVRSVLHDFYEKLKIYSGSIRFLLMTGVTKLTKLSIFSGLNHLTDVSMSPDYATLLGYTPAELDGPLRENVEAFAAKNKMDFAAAKKALLSWYDGYRFSPDSEEKVCNPVSLGNALKSGRLANYWESTGQATIIVNRLKAADEIPADLNGLAATRTQLDVCAAETMPLPALLYQGGYLTISEVIDENAFRLGIPNKEIAKTPSPKGTSRRSSTPACPTGPSSSSRRARGFAPKAWRRSSRRTSRPCSRPCHTSGRSRARGRRNGTS